jgi:hypothetical protein
MKEKGRKRIRNLIERETGRVGKSREESGGAWEIKSAMPHEDANTKDNCSTLVMGLTG